jgi:hypothetical protein
MAESHYEELGVPAGTPKSDESAFPVYVDDEGCSACWTLLGAGSPSAVMEAWGCDPTDALDPVGIVPMRRARSDDEGYDYFGPDSMWKCSHAEADAYYWEFRF